MSVAGDPKPIPPAVEACAYPQGSVEVVVESERISTNMWSSKRLLAYALGIFTCYFYFGIMQEKIMRSKYGEKNEKFTYTLSLVFVQCVVNALFAKLMLSTLMPQGKDLTKTSYYISCSFSYLAAMICSNMALQHVNYPTQVVGKSCKPIPVMILGVLIGRKSYSVQKYMFVTMIIVGVCLFIYKDSAKSVSTTKESFIGIGETLLLFSLAMDGLTGAIQERMKSEYHSKSCHMMYSMNIWSTLYLSVGVVMTGEVWQFIDFVQRYSFVIYNILAFSVTSALGQLFIFLTVSEFGPLPCSIVTTTRKFFTVLGSVLIFGNTLTYRQWLGTTFVFTGLTLDGIYGKSSPQKKK